MLLRMTYLTGAVVNDRILPSKFRGRLLMLDPTLSYFIWLLIMGITAALYAISLTKIKLFDDDEFDTEDKNIEDDYFCEFNSEDFE